MKEQPPNRSKRASSKDIRRITVHPVSPDCWGTLEELFGEKGACNGCWCMYWRIGGNYNRRPRELNRTEFREIVQSGPSPGLLAFEGALAVGWCQVTPRTALPYLAKLTEDQPAEQISVWSISCFYIRSQYRRMGITSLLIKEALKYAIKNGAEIVEAYPVDPETSRSASFTGYRATFKRAGFKLTRQKVFTRLVMRYTLK